MCLCIPHMTCHTCCGGVNRGLAAAINAPCSEPSPHSQPCCGCSADAEGWFRTGDVGEFLPNGALKVIDRKKNFFKLAHGEYVAAEKLENVFKKVSLIDQIWTYGDSEKSALVAVVVPDKGVLTAWATGQDTLPTDYLVSLTMHAFLSV
jgi:acyl-CoA synthetase (AMP-forming)/AMP-acid ligase II